MSGKPIAFVLGGGGVLGAVEVGMLRALLERGIRPDIIVGTSIGAVNGVLVAAEPTERVTARLAALWASPQAREVYGGSAPRQLARFARRGTHLHTPKPLRDLLARELGPPLGAEDFTNLPKYGIYVRMLVDGEPSRPFSAETLSSLPGRI